MDTTDTARSTERGESWAEFQAAAVARIDAAYARHGLPRRARAGDPGIIPADIETIGIEDDADALDLIAFGLRHDAARPVSHRDQLREIRRIVAETGRKVRN